MDFLDVLQNRHSVRRYSGEEISQSALLKILQAGLLSPCACAELQRKGSDGESSTAEFYRKARK